MTDRAVGLVAPVAREVVQRDVVASWTEKIHGLPNPTGAAPFRVKAADVGIPDTAELRFVFMADTGGIADPNPQKRVANALEQLTPAPAFIYHGGDTDYYNGDPVQLVAQFFEPYTHVVCPIVAVPGNHDGDVLAGPELGAFMAAFCASKPGPYPGAEEFGRHAQTQPNCYWTLAAKAATIVGLYTNVPSGGHVAADQAGWLAGELRDAPSDRPLIVVLHHPPYSADGHHGGSAAMGAVLDASFEASKRCPDLLLSGHVHNYQRFTRSYWGRDVPYVVCGNGGYHNLHRLARGAAVGEVLIEDAQQKVVLEAFDDQRWGFLEVTVGGGKLACQYHGVGPDGAVEKLDFFPRYGQ